MGGSIHTMDEKTSLAGLPPNPDPDVDHFQAKPSRFPKQIEGNDMRMIRWMEEILHQLIGGLSHYYRVSTILLVVQDLATIHSMMNMEGIDSDRWRESIFSLPSGKT